MKKIVKILLALVFLQSLASGQAGLDELIIETYYIADSLDSGTSDFPVPLDAKTYRIYVDMAPGWGLQALYASTNVSTGEVDTLVVRSTLPFFNHEDRGRTFGYQINAANLDENTVALDSWFSTGRSSGGTDGVLKPEDNNAGAPAFPNLDGLLQNNDPAAGLPISSSDGNIPGTFFPVWTLIGIALADLAIFDNINLVGNEWIENDGAFTSFSTPLQGPNANNRVLIGQFTTAGTFSGQLNLQIKNFATSEVQQWVAESPTPVQFSSPSLKWKKNDPPTVTILLPADSTRYLSGDVVHVSAVAMDPDSAVLQVEFFFNGEHVFTDIAAPYEMTFAPSVNGVITAKATGDAMGQTTSAPVFIEVVPYRVGNISQPCHLETACLPIEIFGQGINGIVGFDIEVRYDLDKVSPTGVLWASDDLINQHYFDTDIFIDLASEQMMISVFLNSSAPFGATFSGTGELFCIEFLKRPAFRAEDSTTIWMTSVQETFLSGGVSTFDSVPPGQFSTYRNTVFFGSLSFWADHSPVMFDADQPEAYLVTTISGINEDCDSLSMEQLQPDLNGSFAHDLESGVYLTIERDIAPATDVQLVINSFDAFLTRKLLLDVPDFVPDVFQVIAMDVNRDGVISAGDVSQINQRSVLKLDEFRQTWNYSNNGLPKPEYAPSKDWIFIGRNVLMTDPAYKRSSTFPADNGVGFSKFRVPQPPFCIWTGINGDHEICPIQGIETYFGVLLGDVNGNYRNIPNDGVIK